MAVRAVASVHKAGPDDNHASDFNLKPELKSRGRHVKTLMVEARSCSSSCLWSQSMSHWGCFNLLVAGQPFHQPVGDAPL